MIYNPTLDKEVKTVYCLYRVSTKGQVDKNDIPMQKQACREFAARQRGWIIKKEFQEKGVSGFKISANDRDAVQELKTAALKGEFDVLLVFMFDRIGRIDNETPFVVEWFIKNGIEVWSVNEGEQRMDSHVDKLMNYIRFWQANGESEKTSLRVKTRLHQLVEEGYYTGGCAPFGYKLVKSGVINKKGKELLKLEQEPSEVRIVKIIFEKSVKDGLGSYKMAEYITHLMEIISNEDNIKLAYRNIKRNAGSFTSGTDNKNIKDIEKLSAEKLIEIVRNKLNYYKPKPVRRVNIPKPNGKVRPLGIPCMIDRIVQQCVLQVLEPICEAKFHERNNGFRPNRSTENAIAQCYKMIQQQNLFFVVDIDIKGFFDNVNHSKLIRQIWNIGIRDKRLICIIKQMLKSPVIMPDGSICYPDKGTPQGGLLSPLLANIVLNELDWWVSSQWENFSLHNKYTSKAYNYRVLRAKSKLKEMYIIRYADDFKIFCRNRNDADKAFHAVRLWLKDRLKLDISEEKSKVVNLKKRYSDFLGFKFKAVKKGSKYVVRAHMSDKAVKGETEKLKEKIKAIEHCKDLSDKVLLIKKYNSIVWGIHNYYRYATAVTLDCMDIQYQINRIVHNRLKQQVSRNGIIGRKNIFDRYGKSKMLRFICGEPLCPVGYVQTRNPMYKNSKVCKYTEEGRRFIHQNLKFDDFAITVLHMLANSVIPNRSIEYLDNRVSLYVAQYGKCAITGKPLWIDELHCHHKLPTSM